MRLPKVKKLFRNVIMSVLALMNPKAAHSLFYFWAHIGRSFPVMDWKNPKTHDEKIHWLIVNRYRNPEFGFFADKVMVREYVKKCGLEDMLIPIYEVRDNVGDFDSAKVPDSFVLKTNHACGPKFYEFVEDKEDKVHMDFALKKMKQAVKFDYSKQSLEYHYHYIKPLVYAEQLLNDGHERLVDYKIYVFHGEAKFIMVCTERTEKDKKVNFYDNDWNELDFVREDHHGKGVDRPSNLEYMLKAAGKLGEPFALARIDFYMVAGKLYFGEITLTPMAGNAWYFTDEAEIRIGEKINLT